MPRNSSARPVHGPVAPVPTSVPKARSKARTPLPPTAPPTYAQRAAPNAAFLRATAWHFDASASSFPVTFPIAPNVPPPKPINPEATRFDLATARAILHGPAPPANADADVRAEATSRRRLAQALVDTISVSVSVRLCRRTGKILPPTPASSAVILQFSTYNCPASEKALQMLMAGLARDHGIITPRFVAVDAFFPHAFLLFCKAEDNPIMLTLFSLLSRLLNGMRVLNGDIATLSKTRMDDQGECLFGPAIVGALRRTQNVAHRIGATVVRPRRDGGPPREEHLDLFRGLDKAQRDFFAAAMTKCIADVAVKLPAVVDGVVDTDIDKCLADLLPPHIYSALKAKRSDNIRRVADAVVGAHAAHATSSNELAAQSTGAPGAAPPALQLTGATPPDRASLPAQRDAATPSTAPSIVDLTAVEVVVSQMAQENVALLARHAGTSAAERRARLRAERFTALRLSLTGAFAVPLLPDRPRKRSRDASEGPSAELRADRLHNERADFARSQANAQSVIAEASTSDKSFSNLLRKVSEAAKCLENRYAKLAATDQRANDKARADANAAAARSAPTTSQSAAGAEDRSGAASEEPQLTTPDAPPAVDTDMISDASGDSIATMSDALPLDGVGPHSTGQSPQHQAADAVESVPDPADDTFIADETIADATESLQVSNAKTARLTRRLERALQTSMTAGEAVTDSYASVLVLSDHSKVGPSNSIEMARRSSQLTTAVRTQAEAIVTAVRTTAALDTCLESGQRARAISTRRRLALDAAIQLDDGDLDLQLRQLTQVRRSEHDAVDETAAEVLEAASTFRSTAKDPRPEPNSSPLLTEFIAHRSAYEADIAISLADIADTFDSDTDSMTNCTPSPNPVRPQHDGPDLDSEADINNPDGMSDSTPSPQPTRLLRNGSDVDSASDITHRRAPSASTPPPTSPPLPLPSAPSPDDTPRPPPSGDDGAAEQPHLPAELPDAPRDDPHPDEDRSGAPSPSPPPAAVTPDLAAAAAAPEAPASAPTLPPASDPSPPC